MLLVGKKTRNRKRRDCPIKGCYAQGLVKLANHLVNVHNIKSKEKRMKWLKKAKKVNYIKLYLYIAIIQPLANHN